MKQNLWNNDHEVFKLNRKNPQPVIPTKPNRTRARHPSRQPTESQGLEPTRSKSPQRSDLKNHVQKSAAKYVGNHTSFALILLTPCI